MQQITLVRATQRTKITLGLKMDLLLLTIHRKPSLMATVVSRQHLSHLPPYS